MIIRTIGMICGLLGSVFLVISLQKNLIAWQVVAGLLLVMIGWIFFSDESE